MLDHSLLPSDPSSSSSDLPGYAKIYTHLATLRQQAPPPLTTLTLILETSQLSRLGIIAACVLAAAARFDYVQTSTGFNGRGATAEDVVLMRACCDRLAVPSVSFAGVGGDETGGREEAGLRGEMESGFHDQRQSTVSTITTTTKMMQVKASGGIHTVEDAVRMLEYGASRLGTSEGVWIVKEAREARARGTEWDVSQGDAQSTDGGNSIYDGSRRASLRPAMTTRLFTDY